MPNIPTDLLRTFVTAIEAGSFTRAAELVGRTQSAVSLQIRRLEETVDATLFRRDAHRLQLTAEGDVLAGYARRILALNDEALAVLHRPAVAGRVRLGAPHEYTASLLPVFLGRFAQAYPDVMLEVTSDLSRSLLRRQQKGEFDLVIALDDDRTSRAGTRIFTEPLVWIGSADHARQQESPVPLVLAPAPCIYRRRILDTLDRLGRPGRVTYLSSSYSAILAAVRAGLGITAMAGSTVPADVRPLGERDGVPALGELDLRLHRLSAAPDSAITCLEDYIAGSFAGTRPSQGAAPDAPARNGD